MGQTRELKTVEYMPPTGPRQVFNPEAIRRYLLGSLFVLILATVFAFWMLAVHVHLNIWWFESLHLGGVYGREWDTQKWLFIRYAFLAYVFLTAIFFATRALTYRPGPDQNVRAVDALVTLVAGVAAMILAMLVGSSVAGEWQQYLLAHHSQAFGTRDPIHDIDLSFYIFTMPWRETLSNFAAAGLFLAAVEIGSLVGVYTYTSPYQTVRSDVRRILAIGSLFAAMLFGYLAWRNFFLSPYNLQQPGAAFGGGATFTHAALWWYPIVGVVEVLTAIVLLVNTFLRRIDLAWIAVLPVLVGIMSGAGQGIFQHFVVAPNELSAEYRYLGYTLHSTRQAYGMDGWKVREYTPRSLQTADILRDQASVSDARIADNGAVTQVLRQRQENRTYYTFNTANIDRYSVAGKTRQVLLAARELAFQKLPGQAQTWVNLHLKFTHGFGLTMTPANTVTRDGQPLLWIQNIPVQETVPGLAPVKEPRIYFGEYTDSWILTNASTPEFDTSHADRDTSYRYAGPDGVPVGSGLKRLSITWAQEGGIPFFDKLNISGYIHPSTRILLHRNIFDRVQTIAPWLNIDSNPYLVLRPNGSLVWMLDGITHSDHYPYSDPTNGDNYRRNSVKIVVNAYTGQPSFYAFDPRDPILRSWMQTFPGLVRPFSQMPADLVAHIKYPDDYLAWQADAYQRYHVTDVTSYYNGDNQWDIENSSNFNWTDQAIESNRLTPIWTVARLFGEKRDSFFSILPFSVRGKATMAGYLAADNNSYRVTALDMPRGAQTTGVTQFESLYNQAPAISQQITLLDQHGSQVIPGQILILPVGKALLYLQPLYLRSQTSQSLPQLIKVVVGTQNAVNWGSSLDNAISNLLTQGDISNIATPNAVGPGPGTSVPNINPPSSPPSGSSSYSKLPDAKLISLANGYYQAAQNTPSLSQKDRDLRQVGAILRVLRSRHR